MGNLDGERAGKVIWLRSTDDDPTELDVVEAGDGYDVRWVMKVGPERAKAQLRDYGDFLQDLPKLERELPPLGAFDAVIRAAKVEVQGADGEAAQRKTEVDDLEFQIKGLRAALAAQSEGQELEEERYQRGVSEAGKRADELDRELLEMASRFCAPLRMRPELTDLFHELEADAAA
jgi:hypothetical protein